MSRWSPWVHFFGLLSVLLALAVIARLVRRQAAQGPAWLAGAVIGFCGWAAFLRGYRRPLPQPGSLVAAVWLWWCAAAVNMVPMEAGLLGWLATKSRWRWLLLGTGLLLALVSSLGWVLG